MQATVWETFPDKLKPINLQYVANASNLKFPHVKSKDLEPSEKEFLAQLITKGFWNPYDVERTYGISRSTIRGWVSTIQDPTRKTILPAHRPPDLDQESKIKVKDCIFSREVQDRNAIPSYEVKKILINEKIETRKRRFDEDAPDIESVNVSQRSEKRYRSSMNIEDRVPQPITEARIKASFCPRVTYTWLCILVTLSGHLKADNKWNADATTFKIDLVGTGSRVSVVRDVEENYTSSQPIRSLSIPTGLPVFIKWLELCSASGELSPLVFWVAVDEMDPDAFHVATVPGLSHISGNINVGYIVFTKTRNGNIESWKWWFNTVAIPTINLSRNINDHKNTDNSPMRSFLSMDGESIQLEASLDIETMTNMHDNGIDYAKGPPSATGLHQACDRSVIFRDTKRSLKENARMGIDARNPDLEVRLKKAFQELKSSFSFESLGSDYERRITQGFVNIIDIFKEKILTEKKIKNGFGICGQHRNLSDGIDPEEAKYGQLAYSTVDAKAILNQCFTAFSEEEKDHMMMKLPIMMEEIIKEGKLTDEFMDSHNIPKLDNNHVARDDLVIWRQHATVLTNEEIYGKYTFHLMDQFTASDPVLKARAKEKEQLEKMVRDHDEKEHKKQLKLQQDLAEKERVAGMTAQEKAREKQEKAVQQQEKKAAKTEKDRQNKENIQIARNRLATEF